MSLNAESALLWREYNACLNMPVLQGSIAIATGLRCGKILWLQILVTVSLKPAH